MRGRPTQRRAPAERSIHTGVGSGVSLAAPLAFRWENNSSYSPGLSNDLVRWRLEFPAA